MSQSLSRKRRLAVAGLAVTFVLAFGGSAAAQTGGPGPPGEAAPSPSTPTNAPAPIGPPGRATLNPDGTATAPSDAPPAIQAAIAAGNAIHTFPYIWGGGHQSFTASGYDCS